MNNEHLIFILYDSITNSVFNSQVLQPLINRKKKQKKLCITIVSFERTIPSNTLLNAITAHDIEIKIFKRYPFFGFISLKNSIKKLYEYLLDKEVYTLTARGPQAAFISFKSLNQGNCKQFTIQARGLLTEEFMYQHQTLPANKYYRWFIKLRKKHIRNLEDFIYNNDVLKTLEMPAIIEAVSPALREYLIRHYTIEPSRITIATNDIPKFLTKQQKALYANEIRTKLGISSHAFVYCYNGSIKPWQCPEKIIDFFKAEQVIKKNCFLLVLTQNKNEFKKLLKKAGLDPASYYVCFVSHEEIYRYLAACDVGLLFREHNIINWISRPTKALEYHAAGLPIIHNNSVAIAQYLSTPKLYSNKPAIIADNKLDNELPSTVNKPNSHNHCRFSGTKAPMPPI